MPRYELVFIVQPEMEEGALATLVEGVTKTINSLQGCVHQVDSWGKRRLAYPIKKHKEGFYFLMQTELPSTAIRSLEKSLLLAENIIRHLIVRTNEAK